MVRLLLIQLGYKAQLCRLGKIVLKLLTADHQAHHIAHVVFGAQPLVVFIKQIEQEIQPGEQVVHQLPLALITPIHLAVGNIPQLILLHRPPPFCLTVFAQGTLMVFAGVALIWITPP